MRLRSPKENLDLYFRYLAKMYDRDAFPEWEGAAQFFLEDGGETHAFFVKVEKGEASHAEGVHPSPLFAVRAPASVWFEISNRQRSPAWAFLTRRYRVEGKLSDLKAFQRVFAKRFTPLVVPSPERLVEEWENPSRRRWEKPSRVLVLTGSPRRRAGFTGLYLQPLVDGMKSAGAEVEVVDVYDRALDLEPCLGCFACWRSGPESCSLKGDDAALLLARIEETLLVVWALPLYADSVPARVKTLLDRHFILLEPVFVPYGGVTRHPVRWPRPRYTALFAVCGFPEVSHFDPLVAMFEDVARNGHRPLVATLLRPGAEFLAKAPTCAPYLRRVLAALEEAGRELVLSGRVPKAISRTVSSGFGIPPDTWREQANMHFHLESRTEPGGGPHA